VRPGLIIENQATAPAGLLGRWLERQGIASPVYRTWREGLDGLPAPAMRA